MSVRERILFRTDLETTELAHRIGSVLAAQVRTHPTMVEILLPMAKILNGVAGEFGGPLVRREPEWPYREPDEWEATDAYDLEWRLWQANGPRVDEGRQDLELAAATVVFEHLAPLLQVPVLHVHLADRLVAAYHPEHGVRQYPPGTTIYDWDAEKWGPWVWPSPASPQR